ncbi:Glutamine amidotransferase type-2 domain-containing protein [Candidatus Electrothrix aarhusensis]
MCGIAGLIHSNHDTAANECLVQKMCSVIQHRGPDHTGIWCENRVGLGMTRLSIIDRAGGFQPIHNEDSSMWIVFNGEIYNFKKLRRDLENKGHSFYTHSDTETILHLYEEYGDNCVNHLRGMFAFAIWDGKAQKLFIARDRLGIKPLHYFFDGNCLLFGSEIKSLLQSGVLAPEVDYQSLVYYFFYGYTPDPDCMFKGVSKLPPGHTLVWQNNKIKVSQYWDVQYRVGPVKSEEYYIERSLEIMRESVRMRLMSEVPLGAFLSGGVDSSLVVALMAQEMSSPVKTFSIGFEEQNYDELHYARMVAEKYGTDHHEEIVRPDAEEVILDLVRQFDEPFADSSAIPTYYVSKMTKKWVTVSLSGDGGDELFGGYTRYREGILSGFSQYVPDALKKIFMKTVVQHLPFSCPGINTLRYLSLPDDEQIIWKYSKMLSPIHKYVFTQEMQERALTDPAPPFARYLKKIATMDRASRMQYLDTKTYLPGDILTKVDRMSMLVALEARVPLLDHHLVEFAATIPAQYKVKNGETKYLLKKIAERFLPHEVIYRPKQGFAVPVSQWINNEWREMARDLLIGKKALDRHIFNPIFLQQILNEHETGREDRSHAIWTLMVLELWFREYID